MTTQPAIAVIELNSVAVGTHVADAMIKRAPIETIRIGTVQPGKFIILVGGSVAAVSESHNEGVRVSGDALTDEILLPDVHEQVFSAVVGERRPNRDDAVGIIETSAIPANVRAADRAVKAANVSIMEIRLGDGLGGWGLTYVTGALADVQAAVHAGVESVARSDVKTRSIIIPAQHAVLRERIEESTAFNPGKKETDVGGAE